MIETLDSGAGIDLRRSRRNGRAAAAASDRLPPHSQEAEQGVLGCILWDAACLTECERAGAQMFYDLRHGLIFEAMQRLRKFDLILLQQHLKDRGELEQVGGVAYLSSLMDAVPSAANLGYYLGIVAEKAKLRNIITTCTEVAARAHDFNGDLGDLLWSVQSDLVGMLARSDDEASGEAWNIGDLSGYDTGADPNCLLGVHAGKTTRYLCRGHGAWLIGPSGVGKSSLTVQQAILWGTGRDFCGIMPVRPLRILIVQAENDLGDAAEQVQGIIHAMDINEFSTPAVFDQVRENVKFLTERRTVGAKFARWLERQIIAHRADVVVIDPLLSFAGIDVTRQDQTTNFLRSVLNPVLADTGAALIGAHHTGKPKNAKDTANWTIYDHAYAGIGSSELVNWARAISVLVPIEPGKFELRLAKRGPRAWATHPSGEKTTSLYLRHAVNRIHWEQMEPPAEAAEGEEKAEKKPGAPSKIDGLLGLGLGPVLDTLTPPVGLNEICRRLENFIASKRVDTNRSTCQRLVAKLVSNGAIVKVDGQYRKA